MVVVVIIGILAAIAIPSYNGFQDRARGSEAKVQLSAIYTAEAAYFAEWNKYEADLSKIGISAKPAKYYLAIGFTETSGSVVTTLPASTVAYDTAKVDVTCKITAAVANAAANTAKFKACAQRKAGTTYDPKTDWNIDQVKNLKAAL